MDPDLHLINVFVSFANSLTGVNIFLKINPPPLSKIIFSSPEVWYVWAEILKNIHPFIYQNMFKNFFMFLLVFIQNLDLQLNEKQS